MRFRFVGISPALISLATLISATAPAVVDGEHTENYRQDVFSDQSESDEPKQGLNVGTADGTRSNGGGSEVSFSAQNCVSRTHRSPSESILRDPNDRTEAQSRGIHLLVGETVCVAAELDPQGRVHRLSPAIGDSNSVTIALRLNWTAKGSQLQIATTSDRTLHYHAFVPISGSRLVIPTSTMPVRPGAVGYEFWPTDIEELWFVGLQFLSPERGVSALPPKRRTPSRKGPADRHWGIELGFSGGLAQSSFEDLDRHLAAEGFGHVDRNHSGMGFLVGGFRKPLRFGLFVRGVGKLLASDAQLEARWFQVGPYVGLDLYRWRWLTTFVQVEYEAGEVTLKRKTQLPGFATSPNHQQEVARGLHGLFLGIGHEFHLPIYSDSTGQVALTFGTKLGYTWQLAQGGSWHYKQDQKELEATAEPGPSLDGHGWRLELRVGIVLYGF